VFAHFCLEIRGVLLQIRRFPKAKSFLGLSLEHIISHRGAADALVHHAEAVVRERLIIPRVHPNAVNLEN
jgi:hypothetical protein